MDAELYEIDQHLRRFPPFDSLSEAHLERVVNHVSISYFRRGEVILAAGDELNALCYVRSGAVEVYRRNGELYNRLDEGEIFGHFSLLRQRRVHFPATAIEDSLIYFIDADVFDQLCQQDSQFADFVELEKPRLQSTIEQQQSSNNMLTTRIRKLVSRSPVVVSPDTSVQEAAQRLRTEQSSALLVIGQLHDGPSQYGFSDTSGTSWQILGIITDSDLRDRVLAEGLPGDTPIEQFLAGNLIVVQSDVSVNDALLVMLRNNISHLPVIHGHWPIGIVQLSDIIRYETRNSAYLINNIFSQRSSAGLARLNPDVRQSFLRLVDEGANYPMIASAMSTIGRAFSRRLLELAEAELGPPPVPYCFMALGSMARNEQLLVSDQDNALVLDNSFVAAEHDAYFAALAERVSDGLAACGYSYCKGGIMATNPRWRQPLAQWQQYFRDWIIQPSPEKLLYSSIFFDLDCVAGEAHLVTTLRSLIAELAPRHPLFLAALARNALNRTPPLGLFRTFVVESDGRETPTINLKRRGTAPLIDLIRTHALACGSQAQNSHDRLDDIAATPLLASGVADKLRYALEYLSMARIHQQAEDIHRQRAPGNEIDPDCFTGDERRNLKDAFQTLDMAQKFLRFRYPMPNRQ